MCTTSFWNRICDEMVFALASSTVDHGFELQSDQAKRL